MRRAGGRGGWFAFGDVAAAKPVAGVPGPVGAGWDRSVRGCEKLGTVHGAPLVSAANKAVMRAVLGTVPVFGWDRSLTGVRSFGEARKEGTGCCSLRKACLCERIVARWQQPGKRRRALLESTPPRNTRLRTHRNDERGVRPQCRIPSSPTPDRIDRSAPAWKTPAALSRRPVRRERFFELHGRHVP